MTTFAERLDLVAKSKQLTNQSIALESGYSEGHISALRAGRRKNPTLSTVECIAKVLGVPPSLLAGWD